MKYLLAFTLLLLPFLALAQSSDSTTRIITGVYASPTVYGARALTSLNQQLQTAGHAPLIEALIGMTLGTTHRFADQNSYGASHLRWLVGTDDDLDNRRSTVMSVWELGGFGYYDLIPHPKWLVYPSLGVGFSYARLTVSNIEPAASFQSSLSTLGDAEVVQKKYSTGGIMIFGELGAGVERQFSGRTLDWYLGLGGGYRLSTQQPWMLSGVKLYDETFNTQGWTAELKIRIEMHPDQPQKVSRGIYRYFQ